MEALSLVLCNATNQRKSGIGIKLTLAMERIPCLLFADDCLIFCKADSTNCSILKTILDEFCNQSGQLINYHKSSLTYSKNATATQRQLVAGIFNITHSESLGKYLGYPIFQQRIGGSQFQGIINKATTKLNGSKANSLSKAGRRVLIQSHLEALAAHTIQCFELPKAVMSQLDSINREFFGRNLIPKKG